MPFSSPTGIFLLDPIETRYALLKLQFLQHMRRVKKEIIHIPEILTL